MLNIALDMFKDRLLGKRIICPCDSVESAFYIYLKENGFDVTISNRYENVDYSKFDMCINVEKHREPND